MRDLNGVLEKGSDVSQGAFTWPARHASLSSGLLILGLPVATPQLCHMAILQPPHHTELAPLVMLWPHCIRPTVYFSLPHR